MTGAGRNVISSPPPSASACAAHVTWGTAKRSTSQPPLMRASAIAPVRPVVAATASVAAPP